MASKGIFPDYLKPQTRRMPAPLMENPVPIMHRSLSAPATVKKQSVQEPSTVQAFLCEWFPDRLPLCGEAGNNNSFL